MRWLDSITNSMDMNLSELWRQWRTEKPGVQWSQGLQRVITIQRLNNNNKGHSVFNFQRNCHIVFHSLCTILHSHQTAQGFHFFLTSSLILAVFQVFLIVAILMHVRCFLIVVFICIFLIISGMKHLSYACWPFVCHLWRSVYSSLLCIICIFNVVVDT